MLLLCGRAQESACTIRGGYSGVSLFVLAHLRDVYHQERGLFPLPSSSSHPPPSLEWLTPLLLLDSLCYGCQHHCCAFCRYCLLPICQPRFYFLAATTVVCSAPACSKKTCLFSLPLLSSCNHWAVSFARRKGSCICQLDSKLHH